jgi:hypothetical protein
LQAGKLRVTPVRKKGKITRENSRFHSVGDVVRMKGRMKKMNVCVWRAAAPRAISYLILFTIAGTFLMFGAQKASADYSQSACLAQCDNIPIAAGESAKSTCQNNCPADGTQAAQDIQSYNDRLSAPAAAVANDTNAAYADNKVNTRDFSFTDFKTREVGINFMVWGDSGSIQNPALADRGAIPTATTAVAALFSPPASTETYVADLMNSAGFHLAQPAYAQGLGFSALDPILEAWKIFRNMAYFFYVIMFLVIGFMIMFRKSIGSQTAVGIQQALPKIVISLLAVTFSYAIAGLLIDVMYLAMFFIVNIFAGTNGAGITKFAISTNIFSIGINLIAGKDFGVLGSVQTAAQQLIISMVGDPNNAVSQGVGWIGGLTASIIFGIAMLFAIFRLFFELLKTYVSIVIAIVLSPLALLFGALPGNNAFQSWLKLLIGNLAVFPTVLVLLALAYILKGTNTQSATGINGGATQFSVPGTSTSIGLPTGTTLTQSGFLPPYLIGQGNAEAIATLLGMGILLLLPDLVIQVKKTLGGSGGIFEQFGNNLMTNLGQGWKGGQLVPGLGFTQIPGAAAIGSAGLTAAAGPVKGVGSFLSNKAIVGGLGSFLRPAVPRQRATMGPGSGHTPKGEVPPTLGAREVEISPEFNPDTEVDLDTGLPKRP